MLIKIKDYISITNYLLLRENNQKLYLFLYKKYNEEVINKIELNWCNEEIKTPAPLNNVNIPNKICKKIVNPKTITGLNKETIFFL